jgi:deoxyribonuclease-4
MRLGSHMKVTGGKHKALERAKELGCESMQIFIRSVRSWSSGPLKEKDVLKFLEKKEELEKEIWPILSHNSYLINLASSDKEKLEKSHLAMLDELIKAEQLKLNHVNIHPGVIPKEEEKIGLKDALSSISNQINLLFDETKNSNVGILLETTAGQGTGLGSKFEDLKEIITMVKDKKRIGVCFDTSHAFAAGYDFTNKKKYEAMWNTFDDIIGLKFLLAFHLNDSETDLGSKVDRHAHIGKGKIKKEAFRLLLNDERFEALPGIIETPKGDDLKEDKMNLKTLRSLIEK